MNDLPRIAVLMGGPSAEHEISLRSGHGIATALSRRGWSVTAIVIPQELTVGQAGSFTRQALNEAKVEAAFIALHGPFGEDGTIQAICEELHIAYTGSDVQASRLGLDKVASRLRFEQSGLAVPAWQLVDLADRTGLESCAQRFGFPVVVKPTNQGSSLGVSLVTNEAELQDAIQQAARYDHRILMEAYVQGRELTVGILGADALPLVEISSHHRFFDYTAKYTPGQTEYVVPAPIPEELARQIQACGLLAHQALGCRHLSRVDLILDGANSQPVILEVNTIPGFTATSLLPKAAACAGIAYDELCERVMRMALSQRQRSATESQKEESIVHITEKAVGSRQ
ncbi:MAG: D-alanine--D-alanine ligase [Candidatus Omnitrophica bacterium]|nr:D-alanine--D-alanine ligase [Candidatus Omnitrophota bacterium]